MAVFLVAKCSVVCLCTCAFDCSLLCVDIVSSSKVGASENAFVHFFFLSFELVFWGVGGGGEG